MIYFLMIFLSNMFSMKVAGHNVRDIIKPNTYSFRKSILCPRPLVNKHYRKWDFLELRVIKGKGEATR